MMDWRQLSINLHPTAQRPWCAYLELLSADMLRETCRDDLLCSNGQVIRIAALVGGGNGVSTGCRQCVALALPLPPLPHHCLAHMQLLRQQFLLTVRECPFLRRIPPLSQDGFHSVSWSSHVQKLTLSSQRLVSIASIDRISNRFDIGS